MNEDRKSGVRLIWLFLVAAAFVSGVQTYAIVRDLVLHAPNKANAWLIPAWLRLPQGLGLVLNVLFEILLFWLIVQIFRSAIGTERILLVSFFLAEFLGQIQALVPSIITPIRIVQSLLLATAFICALLLLYATWKAVSQPSPQE